MPANISDHDKGKTVMMGDDKIGTITDVQGSTAYVDPDPSLTDKVKAKLDWGEPDDHGYPVDESAIDTITDDEVHLHSM
jgi:hypothetical protein